MIYIILTNRQFHCLKTLRFAAQLLQHEPSMIKIFLTLAIILSGIFSDIAPAGSSAPILPEIKSVETRTYNELATSAVGIRMPSPDVFEMAYKGYITLKGKNGLNRNILTIADFSLPSTEKRLWVFDMDKKEILFNEWVAHGKNSGENYAAKFSNIPHTNMSSIGFYITGDTYSGKHGLSLYLDGQEEEFNSKARERAIVIHGADYVSENFIKAYGRLGRSFGCPALSMDSYKQIIESISRGSCLFIYYPDKTYLKRSTVLN